MTLPAAGISHVPGREVRARGEGGVPERSQSWGLPARPAGLRALGCAVEAPIGLLEANVVSQLVTGGVELTHLPPGLQRIWVGGWGPESPTHWHQPPCKMPAPPPTALGAPESSHSGRSSQPILEMQGPGPAPPFLSPQPMIQVAPESLHHLAALLLGHKGCGAEGQGSGDSEFGWTRWGVGWPS